MLAGVEAAVVEGGVGVVALAMEEAPVCLGEFSAESAIDLLLVGRSFSK